MQAHNAVGFGALSSPTPFRRPLVSYNQDNVFSIFTLNPSNGSTNFGNADAAESDLAPIRVVRRGLVDDYA